MVNTGIAVEDMCGDTDDLMMRSDQIDSDEEDDSGRFASPHIFP